MDDESLLPRAPFEGFYGTRYQIKHRAYMLTKGHIMLGYLFEKATAVVSETIDAVVAVSDYVIEDIQSIPDSIEKGWDEGVFTPSEETPLDEQASA